MRDDATRARLASTGPGFRRLRHRDRLALLGDPGRGSAGAGQRIEVDWGRFADDWRATATAVASSASGGASCRG